MQVTMRVNGESVSRDVEARLLLVHFLRDELDLTGTHWGCDTSNCGACVVLMDGEPVKSCTVLAAMASGHEVRTVESLEQDGFLDPVQQGFIECHGLQCGFCTPGFLMTALPIYREEIWDAVREENTAAAKAGDRARAALGQPQPLAGPLLLFGGRRSFEPGTKVFSAYHSSSLPTSGLDAVVTAAASDLRNVVWVRTLTPR